MGRVETGAPPAQSAKVETVRTGPPAVGFPASPGLGAWSVGGIRQTTPAAPAELPRKRHRIVESLNKFQSSALLPQSLTLAVAKPRSSRLDLVLNRVEYSDSHREPAAQARRQRDGMNWPQLGPATYFVPDGRRP